MSGGSNMAESSPKIRYFLGANSPKGFVSLYDQWIDQTQIRAYYVIKGGAGCGKSTLMKAVARYAEEHGESVEYIICSGDPDSLDGILLPGKGIAVADGTAPHRIDPDYPGASGHYVDLGAGYDRRSLLNHRAEVIQEIDACRSCYAQAYLRFQAAKDCMKRGRSPFVSRETVDAAKKQAKILLEDACRIGSGKTGRRIRRFLGGATCRGNLFLEDTVRALCDHGYYFKDECGLAHYLLDALEKGFQALGYDVISCPDPYQPDRLAHLLVPELSLAFVSEEVTGEQYALFRTKTLVDRTVWRENLSFLLLSSRIAEELAGEGIHFLAQAKNSHDKLEQLYRPFVDFSAADRWTEQIQKELGFAE